MLAHFGAIAEATALPVIVSAGNGHAYLDAAYRRLHEGVDTNLVRPDPHAAFRLESGEVLSAEDEVVTYVARNLEPYRGFHIFMRALPQLLKRRKHARVHGCRTDRAHSGDDE